MGKHLKDSKIAKQIRSRVSYHRDWNKILIRDSIRDLTQASSINFENKCSSSSQGQPQNTQDYKKMSAREQLRRWALKYNNSKCAVTALLKILIAFGLIWLPKESRSLFHTPRKIEMSKLTSGQLW